MNKKITSLSVAISLALGTGLLAPSAVAEEAQVEKLQKMKVTGSRLTRASMEGSTPIAVIGKAEIERAGDISIADVLRKTSYNSFGSFSERSGSSAQSQATIALRGLGSTRTLVLVNGKRLPGSASMGGGSANINMIPAAVVERVEIMADGGSAVYGSDAVAGVVNIILKDEFDGLNVTIGGGSPSREGADEQNASIIAGTVGEKGSIYFSYEQDKKGEVYYRDRDFLRSKNTDSSNYNDMSGVSIYGRNIYHDGKLTPIAGSYDPVTNKCKEGFVGVTNYPGLGTMCGYDYTSEAAQTSSLERNTIFINGNLELSDSTNFNSQVLLSRNESFGRFAPAAGYFEIDPETEGGAQFFADNSLDTTKGPASVYYRFTNVGTRDTTVTDFQADMKFGLDGAIDTNAFGEIIWETGYHLNYSDNDQRGDGYVLRSAVEDLANSGAFVNGEFSKDATDALAATTSRKSSMVMHQYTGGAQLDIAEIGDITVPLYVGAEYTSYDYSDDYDSQSEAGNIIGSAGNSASGDRETYALYAESMVAFTDELEMNLAARYDRYSDFGDAISPKASLRYQPLDNLMFRAGAGLGFRAPTLSDLYAADSFSADSAKDYIYCEQVGLSDSKCTERQYNVTRTSNEDLDAEKSRSFNFGVTYSPVDDLDFTMDYYNIRIEDTIVMNTLQSMIDQERNTGKSNPNINRNDSGSIIDAIVARSNIGTLETSGIDFKANYLHDLANATLRYDFSGSYVFNYTSPEFVGGPTNNKIGRNGLPQYRFQAGVGVNFLEAHDLYLSADHIADQAQDVDKDYKKTGHITSQTLFNLAYNYQAPWDARITAGVRNMFDQDPSFESDGVTYDQDLYSIQGRVYFFEYSQNF